MVDYNCLSGKALHLQRCHDVHEQAADRADGIERLSAELFAERARDKRDDSKPKRVHGHPDGCLEGNRAQISGHRRKPECVRPRRRSYGNILRYAFDRWAEIGKTDL